MRRFRASPLKAVAPFRGWCDAEAERRAGSKPSGHRGAEGLKGREPGTPAWDVRGGAGAE